MTSIMKMPPTIPVGAVLRKPDAMKYVGLKGTTFDRKVRNNELPQPIKLTDSGSAVAWVVAELDAWLQRRIAKRDGEGGMTLRYAFACIARGWHVFPAPATGEKKSLKSAKFSNGVAWGATNDPEEVRRDFARWPEANLGIVCGAKSGIFVLDIDTTDGHHADGFAALARLEAVYGTLPHTLTAVSPSGSHHRYFKHPGGDTYIKNSDSKIAPGVDVRGDGGMVLAPPSYKPGKGRYTWANDLPVADAPSWLLLLAMEPRRRNATGSPACGNARVQVHPALVAACVREILNDDSIHWEDWNNIGMAIWSATGGSAEGFKIFDAWSKQNRKLYDAVNTEMKWSAITGCPPNNIGFGTLFYLANQANPDWARGYDAQLEAVMAAINEAGHD